MNTVQKIISLHGGMTALKRKYIKIENPPYMRLVIEHIGVGPRKMDLISVAHYTEQHSDPIRDPEMTFEVSQNDGKWYPVMFQQDLPPVYHVAVWRRGDSLFYHKSLLASLVSFKRMWDRHLREQGFIEAYERQRKGVNGK